MTQLARMPEQETAIAPRELSIPDLIHTIVDKGFTADSAVAVEKLVAMRNEERREIAKQQWGEAFARVRAKCRKINATRANPDRSGGVRWWMASLIDLQDEVEPILREEGMEVSFNTRREGPQANVVIGICTIMHVATGHEKSFECGVKADNAQGGDLGAATTAKRGALLAALALRVEHDSDARVLGDVVSPEQAEELRRLVVETGTDEAKFFDYAGAKEYKTIRQGKLGQLHDFFRRKVAAKAAANSAGAPKAPPAPKPTEADAARSAQNAAAEAPHDAPAGTNEDLEIRATEIVDGLDEAGVRSMVIGFSREITKKLGPALGDKARPQDWRNRAIAGKVLQLSGMK